MAIVITGASRGIGAALLHRYAAQGRDVRGTSRSATATKTGLLPLDLDNADHFVRLTESLDSEPVELLVCNAGVYLDRGMMLGDAYPPEVWARTFAVNVAGTFGTVQALLPNLQLARGARVAILGSIMGSSTRANGGSYAYRASKAAVLNLGRNLAADLEDLNIAVGVYHPGWVRTDMGGAKASLDIDTSADGLVSRFEALGPDTSGCFEAWDGTPLEY